jgi:hypothetical protein
VDWRGVGGGSAWGTDFPLASRSGTIKATGSESFLKGEP